MIEENELMHIGILRKSGRYPWGSGENPYQRGTSFNSMYDELKSKGLSELEIVKGMGLSSTKELRDVKSLANAAIKAENYTQALKLRDKGYSNVAIAKKLGFSNESYVRKLLNPATKERMNITTTVANQIKEHVTTTKYLDIGKGTGQQIGVTKERLDKAVAMLKEEGYQVMYLKIPQLGTNNDTSIKVLTPPGTTYSELYKNQDRISTLTKYSDDGGRSFYGLRPPININSKRIAINYAEDGGTSKDGIIELRPGVKDLTIGSAKYAQVRIAVDGTHYLKGMAVYSNNLPDGIDIRFNTNKSNTKTKLEVMKPLKNDPDNPFGASIKPGGQRGALNIINEEGDWYNWSKSLSSQMLSKQNPAFIKERLSATFESKKKEFDEIMSLTNPTIRKKLLESFADDVDASSVTLKAMSLPRTAQHVILPIPSMKETEVYAPQYRDGERVVLIRHPHGGIFEIPELTVNNKNKEANSILQKAKDAIGIHPKVAEQLSGADFDGDTVLVIPNKNGSVKSMKYLDALKNFDPKISYPKYDGMKVMSNTNIEMGKISNLITDMSIKGASTSEIARAVRHSMVVIDAEKHELNWKQSEKDNAISELKLKYQGTTAGGSSTLISRASSDVRILDRKARPAALGGAIDKNTGQKMYVNTGKTYTNKSGVITPSLIKTTKMEETNNAFTLSSGTVRETLYADHANKLKALANNSRKESANTALLAYSPSARITYSAEVSSLVHKLNIALKNAPLERQAQLFGNQVVKAKQQADPNMDKAQLKKIKGQALEEARRRTGASKSRIVITDNEWTAIQAGAITNGRLIEILNNADLDSVKKLATPRSFTTLNSSKLDTAKAMLANGYTQSEVADALGVSTSTLNNSLST